MLEEYIPASALVTHLIAAAICFALGMIAAISWHDRRDRITEDAMTTKHYTHNKRGGLYEIITDNAFLQCATDQSLEDTYEEQPWTVYRNIHSGSVYIRLTEEFNDGRFSEVPA